MAYQANSFVVYIVYVRKEALKSFVHCNQFQFSFFFIKLNMDKIWSLVQRHVPILKRVPKSSCDHLSVMKLNIYINDKCIAFISYINVQYSFLAVLISINNELDHRCAKVILVRRDMSFLSNCIHYSHFNSGEGLRENEKKRFQ